MKRKLQRGLIQYECIRKQFEGDDIKAYATYLLVNFCMPTLLKLKPSSMLLIKKSRSENQKRIIDVIGEEISWFDCKLDILYESEERYTMLIYHPELLAEVLGRKENELFLRSLGYEPKWDRIENVLSAFKENFRAYQYSKMLAINKSSGDIRPFKEKTGKFPHEIGIILGYPVEDVKDFIKYRGKDYILCGFWKVYHDAENACRVFDGYRRARDAAFRVIMEGKRIDELLFSSDKFA